MKNHIEEKYTRTIYKQEIRWRDRNEKHVIHGWGLSPEEAKKNAVSTATSKGWTPPKWYQFWRWFSMKSSKI